MAATELYTLSLHDALPIRGGRHHPDLAQIGAERAKFLFLFRTQRARVLLFPSRELGLGQSEIAQSLFPFCFQSAGHEPVFGLKCSQQHSIRYVTSTVMC